MSKKLTGFERFVAALGRPEAMRQLKILRDYGAVDMVEHPLICSGLWVQTGMAEVFHTSRIPGGTERRWALTPAGLSALGQEG